MFSTSSLFHVTNSQTDISNCLTINLRSRHRKIGTKEFVQWNYGRGSNILSPLLTENKYFRIGGGLSYE